MMRTESMIRNLLPTLIVLGIGALAGGARADAQRPEGPSPAAAAAEASPLMASDSMTLRVPTPALHVDPALAASLAIGRSAPDVGVAHTASPPMAIDWRMPSSNALIIGGAATAVIGVLVIKHEVGAAMGIAGTVAALYGLYLRYR
jgi:hypothetical protein